jgi:hypothetical protein
VLQKLFWGGERKFLEPLIRFTQINFRESKPFTWPPYETRTTEARDNRRGIPLNNQQLKPLTDRWVVARLCFLTFEPGTLCRQQRREHAGHLGPRSVLKGSSRQRRVCSLSRPRPMAMMPLRA